jgi:hypothetical protein
LTCLPYLDSEATHFFRKLVVGPANLRTVCQQRDEGTSSQADQRFDEFLPGVSLEESNGKIKRGRRVPLQDPGLPSERHNERRQGTDLSLEKCHRRVGKNKSKSISRTDTKTFYEMSGKGRTRMENRKQVIGLQVIFFRNPENSGTAHLAPPENSHRSIKD